MRLIDADKLIELYNIMADKFDGMGKSIWEQFATTVEWSPTVDAEPVVRCKDCRWQNTSMCWITNKQLLDDYDFCCGGLRREDERTV